MPRRARRLQFGEYYHVINRGAMRARIFMDDTDYQTFVLLLSQTISRFDLPLAAYCVMPNHWHMVVQPKDHNQLSRSLHWLTATHAMRLARTHPRHGPGPVYQGRFKAVPVQSGMHLLQVVRYVERNAFKAKLTPRAEDWPWGSANQRMTNRRTPPLLPLQFLPPDEWIQVLNEPSSDEEISAAVRDNRAIGSEEWTRARLQALGVTVRPRGRPKKEK